uniref:Uncharacterized protein n=1 Tax=Setaria digitata TaxID=48799 RepID=A0A915PXU2_9BILA
MRTIYKEESGKSRKHAPECPGCTLETWGIEPQTSPMRTERSTPELCPLTPPPNRK